MDRLTMLMGLSRAAIILEKPAAMYGRDFNEEVSTFDVEALPPLARCN